MRRVLMIAFHFPPLAGSSGVQRTLRFARHLPASGWEPLVLTANSRAYERTNDDLDGDVPTGLVVRRALAFDTARQLSFRGRYVKVLALPDRWMTWQFGGVRVGAKMIDEFSPDVIWSTYPIATAHVIGRRLHARTGVPWVADFRDPMAQDGYPSDPKTWALFKRIEEDTLRSAQRSVFTTHGALREYARRYPASAARIRVIENGYDEESFASIESEAAVLGPLHRGRLTLLHSGIVYPSERDPAPLLAALGRLKQAGVIDSARLRVRFRAPVHDELISRLASRFNAADLIELQPPIGYRQALLEMLRADGLLVLQASNCNDQIPAKIYEYLRARRPLLVLTDPAGDTAQTLLAAGILQMARLDSSDEICELITSFAAASSPLEALLPNEAAVRAASREERTREFATVLGEATGIT